MLCMAPSHGFLSNKLQFAFAIDHGFNLCRSPPGRAPGLLPGRQRPRLAARAQKDTEGPEHLGGQAVRRITWKPWSDFGKMKTRYK